MKIYSWNSYCFNTQPDTAAAFIESLEFDVLCLQEVTVALLQRIESMSFQNVKRINVLKFYTRKKFEENYLVILSKHPIVYSGLFDFPRFMFPFYTEFLIKVLKRLHMFHAFNRGGVLADIQMGERKIRIINIHLSLWGPQNRIKEFCIATKHISEQSPNIIAGDFNIIEFPPIKIFNWFLGSTLRESLPSYPERQNFEELFAKYRMRNPLRGMVTHDFSRSQLDHILIPLDFSDKRVQVIKKLYGSDHHPVLVEAE